MGTVGVGSPVSSQQLQLNGNADSADIRIQSCQFYPAPFTPYPQK